MNTVVQAQFKHQTSVIPGSYGRPSMTEKLNEIGVGVGQRRALDVFQEQEGPVLCAWFLSLSFNGHAADGDHVTIRDALAAGEAGLALLALGRNPSKARAHLPQIRAAHLR